MIKKLRRANIETFTILKTLNDLQLIAALIISITTTRPQKNIKAAYTAKNYINPPKKRSQQCCWFFCAWYILVYVVYNTKGERKRIGLSGLNPFF
jgi:hypothetical protein